MSPSASYLLPDLTGEFVDDGCIELLSLIGSGAYGKVYKAFDHYDEQHYAVKCMPRYPVGSRGAQIQQAELTIHGSISGHPRVIALHHHFVTDNYVFAVLELAEGGDFFTALVDKKLYSGDTELIKRVFGELLDAVDYIHRNSVYHRDIKPENFLCDADGLNIRLADFGLATRIPLSREFGCGTRSYMTPESINEDDSYDVYSARHSDVWALAIIFTNIISGHVPWNSAELSDPGFRAFRSNPEYLYKALRLSRPAYLLLQQCFDMNPLRRPTIAELRMAINEMDSFTAPHAPPPLPPRPSPKPYLPGQDLPAAVSTFLEWAVATPSHAADAETPRPPAVAAFPAQPIMFSSFIGSTSSSQLSSVPNLLDSSLPPSPSLAYTDSSSSASDFSSSAFDSVSDTSFSTPPTSDAGSVLYISLTLPSPPKPAYLRFRPARPHPTPLIGTLPLGFPRPPRTSFIPRPANSKTKTKMHKPTVAQNARPMLPTTREFRELVVAARLKMNERGVELL